MNIIPYFYKVANTKICEIFNQYEYEFMEANTLSSQRNYFSLLSDNTVHKVIFSFKKFYTNFNFNMPVNLILAFFKSSTMRVVSSLKSNVFNIFCHQLNCFSSYLPIQLMISEVYFDNCCITVSI